MTLGMIQLIVGSAIVLGGGTIAFCYWRRPANRVALILWWKRGSVTPEDLAKIPNAREVLKGLATRDDVAPFLRRRAIAAFDMWEEEAKAEALKSSDAEPMFPPVTESNF